MKILLFDIDWVLIQSEMFTVWLQKKFSIKAEFLDRFFKECFSYCLTGEMDLLDILPEVLRSASWKWSTQDFLDFWFSFENKPNTDLIQKIQESRRQWNICMIASNQEKCRKKYILENMNFKNFFDDYFFSCDMWTKKPKREFFEKIFIQLQKIYGPIDKKDVYFYDDDSKNIRVWKEFGFQSYLFYNNIIF